MVGPAERTPTNGAILERVRALEVLVAEHNRQMLTELRGRDDARQLQAIEYERRLEALNHENSRVNEIAAAKVSTAEWKSSVDTLATAAKTDYQTLSTRIDGIDERIGQLILQLGDFEKQFLELIIKVRSEEERGLREASASSSFKVAAFVVAGGIVASILSVVVTLVVR